MPTASRRKILIIDDEVAIVEGLRKAFHQYRARWEVTTATSGRDALSMLDRAPYDAVICDARMPEMAGDEVLSKVAERWPAVVRVVLTGEVQQAALERLQRCAHHFFRKPAVAATLYEKIEQSLDASARLASPVARELLARLKSMPALPATFSGINRLDASPESTLGQYVEVIERDPAVCANVLRIVNSAWFGLSSSVTSVREAVRLLGLRPLRDIVLASEVYAGSSAQLTAIRDRAIERLSAAPQLARLVGLEHLADVFATGAVLTDVGDVVLIHGAPDQYARLRPLTGTGAARLEDERANFGVDHALLGGVVLTCWGLPDALADAVSMHHAPATRLPPGAHLPSLLALMSQLQSLAANRADLELREEVVALAARFDCDDLDRLLAAFRPSSSPSPA